MLKKTYYIKMTDGINFKIDDVTQLELYKVVNNLCSRYCYYEDNIFLINEEKYICEELKNDHVTIFQDGSLMFPHKYPSNFLMGVK